MKFREPTKLNRKSGVWGTRRLVAGIEPKSESKVEFRSALKPPGP
jgi:hypothetical protein